MALNGGILIVDDDGSAHELLAECLGAYGYVVVHADGGTAMREAVEKSLPGACALDLASHERFASIDFRVPCLGSTLREQSR
jgi:DNA-binding NtrC family response regulator